jgi:hypothetical protein
MNFKMLEITKKIDTNSTATADVGARADSFPHQEIQPHPTRQCGTVGQQARQKPSIFLSVGQVAGLDGTSMGS